MRLFYREEGITSRHPVIILHGLWGASENWLQVASYLSTSYHVIIPDLPNHGSSPHITHHDYKTLAEDIYEFITQLNLPVSPYLIGHSMGGKTLMALLLQQPGITSKAVIIDISPKDYEMAGFQTHQRLINYILSTPVNIYEKRSDILRHIKENFPEEEIYQLLAKNIHKNKENGKFEWKINARIIQENSHKLTSWPHPGKGNIYTGHILFVKGEKSNYINKQQDRPTILQLFPQARFTTIPHAGHAIHAEQPELLAEKILAFLQGSE